MKPKEGDKIRINTGGEAEVLRKLGEGGQGVVVGLLQGCAVARAPQVGGVVLDVFYRLGVESRQWGEEEYG